MEGLPGGTTIDHAIAPAVFPCFCGGTEAQVNTTIAQATARGEWCVMRSAQGTQKGCAPCAPTVKRN